tara:strand:+ start:3623 stop:3877 length:255 start_codon:yes stop_codon:yes gene_type:complete
MSDEKKTVDQYIETYIKSVSALEEAQEPFKEQRRELRKEYEDNGWLSKEQQRLAVKAYRLIKDEEDMEQLLDFYEKVATIRRSS